MSNIQNSIFTFLTLCLCMKWCIPFLKDIFNVMLRIWVFGVQILKFRCWICKYIRIVWFVCKCLFQYFSFCIFSPKFPTCFRGPACAAVWSETISVFFFFLEDLHTTQFLYVHISNTKSLIFVFLTLPIREKGVFLFKMVIIMVLLMSC